uniref:Small-conductance mechanosensitive channel n=1 Tax=uncultured Thiotrichaceae bacterium TaxID=298394 RepID=A0A6S6SBP6_9GAMM|nr:MAG: Mechanosensitive ion channel protein MscS [uncultured Thiotrichaceae bacterium]
MSKLLSAILCLLLIFSTSSVMANELTELLTGAATEEISDKVISKDNTPQDDKKISGRIREIFIELDNLKSVNVAVSKGVVTLSGEIDSVDMGKRAVQYARKVEGVVEVENQLTMTRNIERRVTTALERLEKIGVHLLNSLPLFLLAALLLVVFWVCARWVAARQSFYQKFTPNAFIATLVSQLVRIVIIVTGIILALTLLDATSLIGTVLGAAGIVGLAIGFAIRDTVENYIASILLSLRNPFEPNDWVKIEGYEGSVIRLTSRATVLMTADGNHVRIPNSTVFKGIITNYTRNPMRRLGFVVNIEAKQDLLETQTAIAAVVAEIDGILPDPPAKTVLRELSGDKVTVDVHGWVDQEHHSFARVRSEAIRRVQHLLNGEKAIDSVVAQDLGVEHDLDKQLAQDRQEDTVENLLSKDTAKEI